MRLPKLFGEPSRYDTQFTALLKQYQDIILIGGLFLLGVIVITIVTTWTSKPTGTWRYGICKVFLERYAQYPTDLKLLTSGEKQNSAQIGYLITNSYGSQESELMECFYDTSNGGIKLSRVTIDRIPLSEDTMIVEFNKTIPIIMGQEDLDLTMPRRVPQSFEDLKFE